MTMTEGDLVPQDIIAEDEKLYQAGAKKYAPNNWRRGIAVAESLAAMLRHILRYMFGETYDPEHGLHHMVAVRFHAASIMNVDMILPVTDPTPKGINTFPYQMERVAWLTMKSGEYVNPATGAKKQQGVNLLPVIYRAVSDQFFWWQRDNKPPA